MDVYKNYSRKMAVINAVIEEGVEGKISPRVWYQAFIFADIVSSIESIIIDWLRQVPDTFVTRRIFQDAFTDAHPGSIPGARLLS